MTERFFTPDDVWHGGHYELQMDLKPPSSGQLSSALQALWSHPALDGCYLSDSVEPSEQKRVQPSERGTEDRLYGIARLPNGTRVACGTYAFVSQEEGEREQYHSLVLFTPMGALSPAYPVGAYPFGRMDAVFQWKRELDEWLHGIGNFVYERAPFVLGLVGFEIDTRISAKSLEAHGIPDERFAGILWPRGKKLEWYPPTSP